MPDTPQTTISVGDKVRCNRSGDIGVVIRIEPPEQFGLGPEFPSAVFIETDPITKTGIIREPSALEKIGDN